MWRAWLSTYHGPRNYRPADHLVPLPPLANHAEATPIDAESKSTRHQRPTTSTSGEFAISCFIVTHELRERLAQPLGGKGAEDDPMLGFFKHMNEIVDIESKNHLSELPYERGALCDLRIVPGVGYEMFAKMAFDKMAELLAGGAMRYPINPTVRVKSVEVFEHGANSATYEG